MPYTTIAAGTTITAAWANASVRDQVVTPFATTAARDSAITSPVEGMIACITGDDIFTIYTGSGWVEYGRYGAWQSYTPTFSGTISNGTVAGRYQRVGRLVTFYASVTWGGSTSHGASTQTLTLPVTAASVAYAHGTVDVNQGGTGRKLHMYLPSTTTVSGSTEDAGLITNTLPITTWAGTHYWQVCGTYEAAA